MNVVFIMTDTQARFMVGAYGNPVADTPNLDRLASDGIRFDRAYTACPVCTPARGALFSGMHSAVNGAWCNNVAPHRSIPLMGTIVRHLGYRAGYSGKWHLDGSRYPGDGEPGGGFEPDWWYDGKRYEDERQAEATSGGAPLESRSEVDLYGYRVADRAVDFLERVGDDPFVLVASFDEPHGPYHAPPKYRKRFVPSRWPRRGNFQAPVDGKPALYRAFREENDEILWQDWIESDRNRAFLSCNSWIDRQIGRVIDAVDASHGDDTMIIYTSDHGDMFRSHGLTEKGSMMYEETTNIPFIVRTPGGPAGAVSSAVVSHLDVLPTIVEAIGGEVPPSLHGVGLRPILDDPSASVRETAMLSFHRFAINHDSRGGYYPVRAATDGTHKLVINLHDLDELYDLSGDPYELRNLIDDQDSAAVRNRLHDAILNEMDRVRDPLRGIAWANRPWREQQPLTYLGSTGRGRDRPRGFDFESHNLPE